MINDGSDASNKMLAFTCLWFFSCLKYPTDKDMEAVVSWGNDVAGIIHRSCLS